MLKSSVGYKLQLAVFIHLSVVVSKICKFTRNFTKIRTYSSSRSSNWNRIYNFQL